ncbi:hypothetical protein GF325_06575 [Candidatus Bathyarchaeota archaeon]|nr:hypothetical protein [Candidatus Bathyarchaeota archaeon]
MSQAVGTDERINASTRLVKGPRQDILSDSRKNSRPLSLVQAVVVHAKKLYNGTWNHVSPAWRYMEPGRKTSADACPECVVGNSQVVLGGKGQ